MLMESHCLNVFETSVSWPYTRIYQFSSSDQIAIPIATIRNCPRAGDSLMNPSHVKFSLRDLFEVTVWVAVLVAFWLRFGNGLAAGTFTLLICGPVSLGLRPSWRYAMFLGGCLIALQIIRLIYSASLTTD